MLTSMVLIQVLNHLKRYRSRNVQQQRWCMPFLWPQLAHYMVDARPFRRTRSIASLLHLQAGFQCSVKWSLPIRIIQSQRIYGISTFHSVLSLQALYRRSFVIAIRCRVHTIIHRMAGKEYHNQQSPSRIWIEAQHLLRTSGSCRSIARSLLMSLHAAVYGPKAFRRKSRMSRRRFTNGSMAWLKTWWEQSVRRLPNHIGCLPYWIHCSQPLQVLYLHKRPPAQPRWCRLNQLHTIGILPWHQPLWEWTHGRKPEWSSSTRARHQWLRCDVHCRKSERNSAEMWDVS